MSEQEIFIAAMDHEDPVERQHYLDQACEGDSALRERVENLIRQSDHLGSFLEHPPVEALTAEADASHESGGEVDPTIVYEDGSTRDDEGEATIPGQNMNQNPQQDDDEIPLGYLQPSTNPDSLGRLGHYEILEVVGRGAFGTVLRAFDEKLQRVVAVKVLAPEMAATSPARKRFLREARTSAQIRHDNVVYIHAVEDDPIPYLVMEFIPGKTLQQRLDEQGPLDLPDVLRLGKQIADGLAAAHEQDLIHRDIKPGNILLEGGMDERVKITDFGMARTADDASMTQSGVIAGTPLYMAPEQAQGERLDQRADLFSFGSVLYQMLSGRPPFRAPTTMAVLKRVTEDTPRPIQEIIPETPDWMCRLIGHLHAKNPDERYGTAREVSELLAQCAEDLQAGRVPNIPDPSTTTEGRAEESPATVSESVGRRPSESLLQNSLVKIAAAVVIMLGVLGITEATGVTKLSSTVIRLATGSGTLVIETNDPGVTIAINGEEVTIIGGGGEELTLRPGEYKVAALKDGKPVKQELVSITRNGRTVVRMTMEPGGPVMTPDSSRNAATPVPPGNYALSFDDKSAYIEVPSLSNRLGDGPFTIEASVTIGHGEPPAVQRFTLIHDMSNIFAHLQFHKTWQFWRTTESKGKGIISQEAPAPGVRIHVAAVWDGNEQSLYVDGRRQTVGTGLVRGVVLQATNAVRIGGIGKARKVGAIVPYLIDEVRISKVVRYTGAFTPQKRFEPDENTLALYHFDSGAGDVLKDSSGNGHDGTIVGAKWVRVEEESNVVEPLSDGWHQWPADAPPPAIAPFDADQAKAHQEAWAKYLGVPVEEEIVLGQDADGKDVALTMVLIPPGEFLMGSSDEEQARFWREPKTDDRWGPIYLPVEGPQHRVRITRPYYLGKHEVTQAEWESVMGTNPSKLNDDPTHPVEMVSWEDIQPFLTKLNEHALAEKMRFELPTEAQWEYACRAGTTTSWYAGEREEDLRQHDWFQGHLWRPNGPGNNHHPVGELKPNPYGLYDLYGNVMEWCSDWFGKYSVNAPLNDPTGPSTGKYRVVRGGCWQSDARGCRSANRCWRGPNFRGSPYGFRLAAALTDGGLRAKLKTGTQSETNVKPFELPKDAPPPAIARFDAEQAKAHQQAWAKHLGVPVEMEIVLGQDKDDNDVALTMVLIPPGEFTMGSSNEEQDRMLAANEKYPEERIRTEGPQHRVRITRPFWLSRHEVTIGQFQQFVQAQQYRTEAERDGNGGFGGAYEQDPRYVWNADIGFPQTARHPVVNVTWNDSKAFCEWLSQQQSDWSFGLPTEAQWEYACRAGTTTTFWTGDQDEELSSAAWFFTGNVQARTHPVGELQDNPFGLYDMLGNVREWCADRATTDYYQNSPLRDPQGPSKGSHRCVRGGSWSNPSVGTRSACRHWCTPETRHFNLGFRLAATIADNDPTAN